MEKKGSSLKLLCEECDFTAESKPTLNEHIKNMHDSDFWLVGTKRRKRDNEHVNNHEKDEVYLMGLQYIGTV